MTTFAHLITPTGLTAFISGNQYSVPTDHPNFRKIVESVKAGKYAEAIEMIDIRASVRKFISTDVRFALVNDLITFNGVPFCGPVTDKVLELIEAGNAPAPLFKFLEKVRLNPSKTAQDELLLFCVANDFMIDTDGNIVAYKSVRSDFKDVYSGTNDNSVGQVVKMVRNQVDDNRDRTCSSGLHFASYEYASGFHGNGHLMVLTVNPKDVVSIPSDYNNQKGRCAEYTVVAELADYGQLPKKAVYTAQDFKPAPTAAQIRAEKIEARDKAGAKRNRKADVNNALVLEIAEIDARMDAIRKLGGLPVGQMVLERDRKESVLRKIQAEIADLDTKLDVLESELGLA